MIHYRCPRCGLTARLSMTDWIAHRLAAFAAHFLKRTTRWPA